MKRVFRTIGLFGGGIVVGSLMVGLAKGPAQDKPVNTSQVQLPIVSNHEQQVKPSRTELKVDTPSRDQFLVRAEAQFENGDGDVENTFRELDEFESHEFNAKLASDTEFMAKSSIIALKCGLPAVAKARCVRCISSYESMMGGASTEIMNRIQHAYLAAAGDLLMIAPNEADQLEFWPFAQVPLLNRVPEAAKNAHYTIPGMTKKYNDAILMVKSVRQRTVDPDIHSSLDRTIEALQAEREMWLKP